MRLGIMIRHSVPLKEKGIVQRRSQVSLVGGADRIPGGADRIPGGGINLNTYTYKMSRRAA